MMIRLLTLIRPRFGPALVLVLIAALAVARPGIEARGTAVQWVLPLAGLVCAVTSGDIPAYAARFAISFGITHGLKRALGDAPINQRPRGGLQGFPSGHSSAAAFGASYLSRACLHHPAYKAIAWAAMIFVGGSRIAVGAHDLLQVIAGFAVGIGADRLFRRRRRVSPPEPSP